MKALRRLFEPLQRPRAPAAARPVAQLLSRLTPGGRSANEATAAFFEFDQVAARRERLLQSLQTSSSQPRPQFRVENPLTVAVLGLGGQGGSGNVARAAARAMGDAGHRTLLFTSPNGFWERNGAGSLQVVDMGVPLAPREPDASWTEPLAKEIADAARREGVQVLSVHYAAGLLDAALRAKALLAEEGRPLKVSATLHGTDVTHWGVQAEHARALKAQLQRCDEVTAVSEWLADIAERTFDLPRRPRVIPNAADAEVFSPHRWHVPDQVFGAGSDLRRRLAPNGELVIAHVSNLRPVKRPLDAVETFAKVRQQGVPSKLLLIGDGPMLEQLHQRATELGVADHIIAIGALPPDQLASHLAASDALLVTSQSESFCLSALEAMACGVPVVGTRCGGLEEILRTADVGSRKRGSKLLADVGDTGALARAIVRLARDPARLETLQRKAVEIPFDRYPQSRQQQGYLELLEDLRPSAAPE